MNNKREAMRKKYNSELARFLLENGKMHRETISAEIMGEEKVIENRLVLEIEFKDFDYMANKLNDISHIRKRILINGASFFVESVTAKEDNSFVFTLASRF